MVLNLVIIAPIYPNTSEIASEQQQQIQEIDKALEQILRAHLNEFRAIDLIIQDMLLLVENHAIKVNNKRDFMDNALALKNFIHTINNEAFVHIDPHNLYLLGYISQAMMRHLMSALDNHLVDFPAFNLDQVMTRHSPIEEITFDDLQNATIRNGKTLARLSEKAKNAGLHWYHKIYRTFDHYVVQPAGKYKLHTRGLTAGMAGALAAYIYWTTNPGGTVAQWMGAYPEIRDNVVLNGDNLNWLGKFETFAIRFKNNFTPTAAILFGGLSMRLWPEYEKFNAFAAKKLDKLHNTLKGGTYSEKREDKFLINPRVMFKDLVGLDHAKDTLSFIVKYMEDPERFDRARLTPEKGYILTGPTRTGKSYMAEALAGEIKEMFKHSGKNPEDFNFFVLTASFIMTEGIDNIIARAKALAPCILFIDEIDLLGLQRADANRDILSKFLSSMSGCLESDPEKVVIMIAATNKPENLDKALLQAGRFGKEIRFEYPSFKDRKEYLTKKISALADVNAFDIDQLARETEGKSFEQLNLMIKSAFQKGIIRGEILTQKMLETCLDEDVRHIMMGEDKQPFAHERRLIAVHQAGQALAVMLLNSHEKLAKVTTKPYLAQLKEETVLDQYYLTEDQQQKKIKYGKIYTYHEHDTKNIYTLQDKLAQCKIQLAGFAAEKILLGSCGYSYNQECSHLSFAIAKSIASKGLDLNQFSNELKNKYLEKALQIQEQCEAEITELLTKHKDKLQKLADALLEQQTLTGYEADKVVGIEQRPELNAPDMHELGIAETAK